MKPIHSIGNGLNNYALRVEHQREHDTISFTTNVKAKSLNEACEKAEREALIRWKLGSLRKVKISFVDGG